MSRTENEMFDILSKLLPAEENVVKTAKAKEDKEDKEDKKDKKDEKEDKEDKKDEKEDKKSKSSVIMSLVSDLVKLAGELDEAGAEEASSLVDDALRVIVDNIKANAQASEESFEEDEEAAEAGKVLEEFLKKEEIE